MHIIIAIGAVMAMLSVILGAMGAHALESILSPKAFANFHTAADYQMVHGLAIILAGLSYSQANRPSFIHKAAWLFIIGVLLFSGSLYIFSLTGIKAWAMLTPIGGMAFIFGWLFFILGFLLNKK